MGACTWLARTVTSNGRYRDGRTLVSPSNYKGTNPIMGASLVWPHLKITTYHRPYFLTASHWELGPQHVNLGGYIPSITGLHTMRPRECRLCFYKKFKILIIASFQLHLWYMTARREAYHSYFNREEWSCPGLWVIKCFISRESRRSKLSANFKALC